MAHVSDLPCDRDGVCLVCKRSPPEEDKLICSTCGTPWHAPCLSKPPSSLSALPDWQCPDCSPPEPGDRPPAPAGALGAPSELIAAVRAIEADRSLTDKEKARRRQELMSGGAARKAAGEKLRSRKNDLLGLLDGSLICCFCRELPERPVTTHCGHNFCLNCFQKWIANGKRTCAKCRSAIPSHMASQPRINSALVAAIRLAKTAKTVTSGAEFPSKVYHFIHNQDRPDKAFTTERAQRAGKANACSGKIFVTVPPDHFGPILAENDPIRNQGLLVGESWEDRMECRQWGVHLPHVAGIAGQSDYGAQSVALSGGYQDDEDHGEWFLYTGSGGRDLSGNKRTNKEQSFDQQFSKMNEALKVSCIKGYPVRVVRSHKEKRSSYAPETGVRYDGIYRIEKCWRKVGLQGFKVCRYLFVRCDNEPAPWTSDEHGDLPRPLPNVKELKDAIDITERKESPAWDYVEKDGWRWAKPPPPSRKKVAASNPEDLKRARLAIRRTTNLSARQKLLKEFSCLLCQKVMNLPLTTPCAHNFCKPCLLGAFAGQTFVRERTHFGGKSLRVQKNVMKCPCCPSDISDFLQSPQVNTELMDVIENLKRQTVENAELSEDEVNGTEKPDPADEETIVGPRMLETSNEVIQTSKITADENLKNEENVESSEDEINGTARKPYAVDEETVVVPRMLETSNEAIQTIKITANENPVNEANVESSEDEINGNAGKPGPVDEETIVGPRILETSNEVIQTSKVTANENLKNEENVEPGDDGNDGNAENPGPVDEETIVGPRNLETFNVVSQITKTAANGSKYSPAHEQNGIMRGSESNGSCTQITKTPQSFNEDNISKAGPATCRRKKMNDERKAAYSKESDGIMLGRESNGACTQNTKALQPCNGDNQISGAGSKQSAACRRKKMKYEKKVADGKESNGVGSKNTEIIDRSGKDCDISLKESIRPITRSQKKLEYLSKGNQLTNNEQPVTYECKKRGNGKVNSGKKSIEDDRHDVGVANGSGKDLKIPKGKKTLRCQNKTKDIKKERNKCDELNSENLTLLDEGDMDCPKAENKHPKTLMRRPLTRSCSAKMDQERSPKNKESTDDERALNSKGSKGAKRGTKSTGSKSAKKAKISIESADVKKAVGSKRSDNPGSGILEMLSGGDKDHETPKSKQPNTFVRKRPVTRSCTLKAMESNAKRSKTFCKVRKSGNSPSSPHVLSDDDDDFRVIVPTLR